MFEKICDRCGQWLDRFIKRTPACDYGLAVWISRIIASYFVLVLGVGYYLKGRIRSSSDFLLTHRALSHWVMLLRRVDESEILSTRLSPMLRPAQKQKRSSSKQNICVEVEDWITKNHPAMKM